MTPVPAVCALAESRRDGGQLTRCLRALAELAVDPKERVRHLLAKYGSQNQH